MSNPVSENRIYFVKALNEVINRKLEEEMADCNETASTSLRHKIIMKKIAKGKCYEASDKARITKRTILIAIIAAMLALTSCALAIIYRAKIAGFVESFYDDFVHVSPQNENGDELENYPTEIEKVYEFTYIPEGYELKSQEICYFSVINIYENIEGKELILNQLVMDLTEFKTNSENSYSKAFEIGGIEVYYRSNKLNNYAWQTNDYIFQIYSEDELSEKELEKIILGIK